MAGETTTSMEINSFDSFKTAGQEATLETSRGANDETENEHEDMRPQRAASISSTSTPPIRVKLDLDSFDVPAQSTREMDDNSSSSSSCCRTPLPTVLLKEMNSCDSGGTNSNSSSAATPTTARTRAETNSTNGDADEINYDVDPRKLDPADSNTPTSKKRLSSAAAVAAAADAKPPSPLRRCARYVNQQWAYVTKVIRDGMLRVIIAISMVAARYPRYTLIGISILSFGLMYGGYSTNFELRLDNDKMFTPYNSEILEYEKFMRNGRMYEGMDMMDNKVNNQQRARRRTRSRRDLNGTIDVTDEDAANNTYYEGSIVEYMDEEDYTTAREAPGAEVEAEESEETSAPTEAPVKVRRGGGRLFSFLMHADKENVFSIEGMHRIFDVVDQIRSVPGYEKMCRGGQNTFRDYYGKDTCEIRAITRFWNHNRTLFTETIRTEEDLFNAADVNLYPDRGFVDLPFVLAELEKDELGRPIYGEAFYGWFFMKKNHDQFEKLLTDHMLDLRTDWFDDGSNPYVVEFAGVKAFENEAQAAVMGDLPLLPVVFLIMCVFTCLIFFKWHRVHSRSLLGVGAVVTIFMSILSGYGVMFLIGVPMTLMTNLLFFVVFGIGLDDTFIITGAYFRTSHEEDPVQRIEKTMEAVGSSILLTTITTTMAFLLGATSTILPIRWLCLYAFPTIIIDFFYQITFFVALLVLDERRIQQNRMDCCVCITAARSDDDTGDDSDEVRTCPETPSSTPEKEPYAIDNMPSLESEDSLQFDEVVKDHHSASQIREPLSDHVADRFMRWFASTLMNPVVKIIVLVVFAAFAGVCAYSTTKLRQEFNFKDLLPKGSYAAEYVTAVEYYSDRAIALRLKFRFVDQSDADIRDQMEQYISDLVQDVDALNEIPPRCWVREFRNFVAANETLQELPFYDQLDILLSDPTIKDVFGRDISFTSDGKEILSSKCLIFVTDLNMDDVQDQIKLLQQTREVAARQPVNEGKQLSCFFAYDLLFHIFAFYEVAVSQLIVTTILSVASVCAIAFILIPHWSAVPIIFPVISVLYIEMLGVLQMFGYSINVITYIVLVMSIGLLVDFIMHILLRYYESEFETREEKVKDALGTMGASILVGGMSTFLGVTPLIFSTSEIFSTVCIAFLAMVALGVSHGLILLPVLLSYFGTEKVVHHRKRLSLIEITASLSQRIHQSMSDLSHRKHLVETDLSQRIDQSMSDLSHRKLLVEVDTEVEV